MLVTATRRCSSPTPSLRRSSGPRSLCSTTRPRSSISSMRWRRGARGGNDRLRALRRRRRPGFEWTHPRMNGMRSRSTTRPAPPAIQRASSIIIAALISTRCPTSSTGACLATRCICRRSMFHCNGWCFAWTIAAHAGTNVCLRQVEPKAILDAIRAHKVTHYCGAPIVHAMLINAPAQLHKGIAHKVNGLVAAAAPPAGVIEGMQRMGFDITHVYGLTETYGPAAVCAKHAAWDKLDIGARTERNGRQGVRYTCEEGMTVMDPETMTGPVGQPDDRRDHVPRQHHDEGLSQEPRGTTDAFLGGWFHSGDLAVMQPDGYVKIRDRSKDVIISGGENIGVAGSGGRARPPPRGAGGGGGGAARREVGRDAVRVRERARRTPPSPRPSSSSIAASTWRASRRRRRWCLASCPRPRPARSRNSCCASVRDRRSAIE